MSIISPFGLKGIHSGFGAGGHGLLYTPLEVLTTESGLLITHRRANNLQYSVGSVTPNSAIVTENWNGKQHTVRIRTMLNFVPGDGIKHQFFDNQGTSATNNREQLYIDTAGLLTFVVHDKDSTEHLVTFDVTGWTVGTEYQIVCVIDFKNDAMLLYTDGTVRDNTPTAALSSDAIDAIESTTQIGADTNQANHLNGSMTFQVFSRVWTATEVGDDDPGIAFVADDDTLVMANFTDGVTTITYGNAFQSIASISTVTLTTDDDVGTRWIAGERVVVYDDDDPANVVYTTISGTPSGTSITLADSAAAVSGTNKTIQKNLLVDGGFESAGVANITTGATWTATKDTTVVLADSQSLKLVNAAGNDNDEVDLPTLTLATSLDMKYSFDIYFSAIAGASDIYFDIDGSATPIHTRQLNTGTDDRGVSYATGVWLHYEGTFQADQPAITPRIRITGAGAGANAATIYLDKMVVKESLVVNGGMEGTYDDESGVGGGTVNVAPGWNLFAVETDGSDTLDKETTIVRSGSASQKVDVDAQGEGIKTPGSVTSSGDYYTLSAWIYGVSGNVEFLDNSRIDISLIFTPDVGVWTKHSISFLASQNSPVYIVSQGGAATFYVDDVVLERKDTAAASTVS